MSKIGNVLILLKQYFWKIYFMIKSIPPFTDQLPFINISILNLIHSNIVVRTINNVKYIYIYCKDGLITLPHSLDAVSMLAQYAVVSEEIGFPPGLVELKELEDSIKWDEVRKNNQNKVEYNQNIKIDIK